MSDFEREDRYAVIKYKKLTAHQWTLIPKLLEKFDKARVDCVVVEKDWPEYHFVWLMLEHRMAGYPVPDFNAVKCAADVAVAQSELAALREELAGLQSSCAIDRRHLDRMIDNGDDLQQRLTAAEQRNSELTGLLVSSVELIPMRHTRIRNSIYSALKPTESGASPDTYGESNICIYCGKHECSGKCETALQAKVTELQAVLQQVADAFDGGPEHPWIPGYDAKPIYQPVMDAVKRPTRAEPPAGEVPTGTHPNNDGLDGYR